MSYLTGLPVELIDHVSQKLMTGDKFALGSTCKRISETVKLSLYHTLTLEPKFRNLNCLLFLANNPDIARQVRVLTLKVPLASTNKMHCTAFNTALANMTGLIELDIYFADPDCSWVMATPNTSTFLQLNKFVCSFALDDNVSHFLNKTDYLRQLHILDLPAPFPDYVSTLKPGALSNLSELLGSSDVAHFLVPGRPVENIFIHAGDLTQDLMNKLTQSTVPIKELEAVCTRHTLQLFNTILQHMKTIEFLRIILKGFEDPDLSHSDKFAKGLRSLPHLTYCEILGFHWYPIITKTRVNSKQVQIWHSYIANPEGQLAELDAVVIFVPPVTRRPRLL